MTWSIGYNKDEAKKVEEENTFAPLPAGDYEAFITKVDPNEVAGTGAKGIELIFTIREDVEQEGQKRKIYDNIWMIGKDGQPSKAQARVQVLASKLGIPDAQITPDNVIELLYGKPVKITLVQRKHDGKIYNNVDYMGFKEAEHGGRWTEPNPVSTVTASEDPFAQAGSPINIDEDEMPF